MRTFFETFENRTLMSAAPIAIGPPSAAPQAGVMMPMVALPKMVGKFSGTIYVNGIHSRPVAVTLSESSTGHLSGILTTSLDKSIKVTFSGKIKANRSVSVTLNGGHAGGAINGSGSGKLSANGKTITFTMSWVQGGHTYGGSMTLHKV